MSVAVLAAGLALFGARKPADGDLDVELILGGRVVSRIDPADEVETFRVALAAGASVSATATPSRGFPALTLRLLDAAGAELAVGTPKKAASQLKGFVVQTSAVYALQVRGSGSDVNDYTLALSWKTPRTKKTTVASEAAATASVAFVADAGAKANLTVAAARRSGALPQIVRARHAESGAVIEFAAPARPKKSHSVKSVRLPATGDWTFEFRNRGATGDVVASAVVRQPAPGRKPLKPPAPPDVPPEAVEATSVVVGSSGGVLTPRPAPDGTPSAVEGARLDVPRGAVTGTTVLQIGEGADVTPPDPELGPAGRALFLGPDGFEFRNGPTVKATLTFDPASFADGTEFLRVLEQSGTSEASVVPTSGYAIDASLGRVTFPVKHFSRYQVVRALRETKLLASDGAAGDTLGICSDLSGDTLISGAPFHDLGIVSEDCCDEGAAYVHVRGTGNWPLQQKLLAPDPALSDLFGMSVSLDGDTAVVGAPGRDGTGAAFVFVRQGGTWSLQQTLTPSDGASGDHFGGVPFFGNHHGVALDGDTIVVGAEHHASAGAQSGAAYVFVRSGTTWTEQAKLVAADGGIDDRFGARVALDGDLAVVSSDVGASGKGAAYVFVRSGTNWSLEKKLVPTDAGGDAFGSDIDVSGGTVVVGALYDSVDIGNEGAAYVFARGDGSWPLQQKVRPVALRDGGLYGNAVSLDGDVLAIGSSFSSVFGTSRPGAVYVLTRSGGVWTERRVFTAGAGSGIGSGVSVDGRRIVAGSRSDDTLGADAGAVFVFEGL